MAEIVKKRLPFDRNTSSVNVIESEIFDANRQAREILQNAQNEAQAIVREAHFQAKQELERARKEGLEKGHRSGYEKFTEAILHVNREYEELLQQAEDQLVHLAVGISRKIIQSELKVNPAVIVDIVRKAIAPMNRKRSITLRVHPADRAFLEDQKGDLLETMIHGGNILILPDPNISRGGCIVETEQGSIDARLETQLAQINLVLTGQSEIFYVNHPEEPDPKPIASSPITVQKPVERTEMEPLVEAEPEPELEAFSEAEVDNAIQIHEEVEEVPETKPFILSAEQTASFQDEIGQLAQTLQDQGGLQKILSSIEDINFDDIPENFPDDLGEPFEIEDPEDAEDSEE